jgi:hypothetical protein
MRSLQMMSKNISPSTIHYKIPLRGIKFSTNKIYAGIFWKKRKDNADAVVSIARGFCRPVQIVKSYPVEISYKFFFSSRPLDTTNCTYLVKMLEDAFRAIGIIEDDSPPYVAKTIIESHKQIKGKIQESLRKKSKENYEENEDYVEIKISPCNYI